MEDAVQRYDACNRETLSWMLGRSTSQVFLDTKVNPLTGKDYDALAGRRGPAFQYGWIQGRGLEAIVSFAQHYRAVDRDLSERLFLQAQALYQGLSALVARDGHAFFLYDEALRPVKPHAEGMERQTTENAVYTYSDAFVAKGLLAASCHFDGQPKAVYVEYLRNVIAAIDAGRFQMDETGELSAAQAANEPDDFGPRMILLGAAGLLHRCGLPDETSFADRFIDDVLARYYDETTGLLRNVPGQDACNVGHGIEFCGFAFDHLSHRAPDPRIELLGTILRRSLDFGLQGPGIALSLSIKSGQALSPYYPWWPLPEAIRACALGWKLTGDDELLGLWKRADEAFFQNYWQAGQGYAYQTRTLDGPVDFVPATPDLDPSYHTGLSLLAAIRMLRSETDSVRESR